MQVDRPHRLALLRRPTCPVIVGDTLVYRDDSHISNTFSAVLAPMFASLLSGSRSPRATSGKPATAATPSAPATPSATTHTRKGGSS